LPFFLSTEKSKEGTAIFTEMFECFHAITWKVFAHSMNSFMKLKNYSCYSAYITRYGMKMFIPCMCGQFGLFFRLILLLLLKIISLFFYIFHLLFFFL
jgi:hypothetical protein